MSLAAKRARERMSSYPAYLRPTYAPQGPLSCVPVRLDQNENLFLPPDFVRSVLQRAVQEIDPRLYVYSDTRVLAERLGEYVGVPPSCITVGAGSDDLIRLFVQAVVRQGERVVVLEPTFSMYRLCAARAGATVVTVELNNDFSLDVDRLLKAAVGTELIFLCSPNNPTGNQFDSRDVLRVVDEYPGVVVLDEAYVEFADSSLGRLPLSRDNVVVLRTMSKAFGLASLRVGYCVAAEPLAAHLRERVQLPYPVSGIAAACAVRMLEWKNVVMESCQRVKAARQRFLTALARVSGVTVFDSQANFVLVETGLPEDVVVRGMAERGFLVRGIGTACGRRGLVRITVPPPELLEDVTSALSEVMSCVA